MNRIEDFNTNRKRNYPQVGEPTLREDCDDNTASEGKCTGVKTVFAGALSLHLKSPVCFLSGAKDSPRRVSYNSIIK